MLVKGKESFKVILLSVTTSYPPRAIRAPGKGERLYLAEFAGQVT